MDRVSLLQLSGSFGLDCLVSPKAIMMDQILQYIRGKQNSRGSGIVTLYRLVNDQLEAIEFIVRRQEDYIDVPLKDLNLRKDVLIVSIVRGNQLIVPRGDDMLKMSDSVIVVTTNKGLSDLNDIFE